MIWQVLYTENTCDYLSFNLNRHLGAVFFFKFIFIINETLHEFVKLLYTEIAKGQ